MRAVTKPVVRQMHLMLDADDLWALMRSAVDDWKKVLGLDPYDLVMSVTHVDECPGNPDVVVRICIALEEKQEKEQEG
jgi:hypothetical protein